ncbi:hypothetical protein THAR02_07167 [Trichoderma harzianum]|uniref:Uncharacterized protein n=1 Tax=Trichoderma harzianum TaxID=5544 RepID=A0A0F9X6C9_TRIHA|nr:hypothetical protein THAR02_07167 [Trichoderma harzianum]
MPVAQQNELKAQLKHLFENAPEDAKTGGFIGSGGSNIPRPPKDDPEDMPEAQKQINAELKELGTAPHKAIQDEDHETAKELRAQISALRQKSHQESKITSKAAGYFELWIEIHNLDSSRLYNDGGWDVAHGCYRDGAAYSGPFTWTSGERGYCNGRWDSWHSFDGRIVRFYVRQR